MKKPNLKKNLFSTSFVVGALLLTILINIIFSLATQKFNLTKDFTVKNVYSLSKEAKEIVNKVEDDIVIYVLEDEASFASTSAYFYQANQIINHFQKTNKHIKVNYVNLNKNPTFLNNYPAITAYAGDLIVTKGKEYKLIPSSKLFYSSETEEGNVYIYSSRAESAIASAILSLTNNDVKKIAVLTDNEPFPTQSISYLLEDNYYLIEEFSLTNSLVPKDSDIVLLFAPHHDYSKAQIKKLKDFLNKENKTIIYVADSAQELSLPNITSFLKDYGISVSNGVVCETNSKNIYNQNPYSIVSFFDDNEFSGKVPQSKVPVLAPFAKPMTIVSPKEENVNVTSLLKYDKSVVIRPEDADSSWSADKQKKQSNLKAAVVAQKKYKSGKTSSIISLATASLFDSHYLTNPQLSNAEYFVTVLNQITNRKDSVAIADKSLSTSALTMSDSQVNTLMLFFAICLPASILAFGAIVWLKRRKQ